MRSSVRGAGLPSEGVQEDGRQPTSNDEQPSNHPHRSEPFAPHEEAAQNGDRTLPIGDRRVLHGWEVASSDYQESQCEQTAHQEEGRCPRPVCGREGRNPVPWAQDD